MVDRDYNPPSRLLNQEMVGKHLFDHFQGSWIRSKPGMQSDVFSCLIDLSIGTNAIPAAASRLLPARYGQVFFSLIRKTVTVSLFFLYAFFDLHKISQYKFP